MSVLFAGATVVLFFAGAWAQLVPVPLGEQIGIDAAPQRVAPALLPVPSVPQLALERAMALVADDRHAEALGVLATVRPGDGVRGDVDRLRAEIQREMLRRLPRTPAAAAAEYADAPATDSKSAAK